IVDYLFAPIISTECLGHMRILIRDHHCAFKKLYPECNLIPKMHYMMWSAISPLVYETGGKAQLLQRSCSQD
uniref:Uncharacterized protein n=1 Tax=Amphimedon queenslandica TaxID=400682 RepID=A0A1X7VRN4_AMPQE